MWTVPKLALFVALLAPAAFAQADVKLPGIFGDHMVLQRGAKVPVWGTADAGERVTVSAAGQQKSAVADEHGNWRVVLDSINVAKPATPIEVTIKGNNTVTIKDVLVGDVWLCAGQSNMVFPVQRATGGAEALKSAERPTMRLFTVGRAVASDAPRQDVEGCWELCTPATAAEFSAVAYFFGRELQQKLDGVPVGLIDASWGGTRAEAWIPRQTFDALKLPYEPAWTEAWLNPKPDPTKKKPVPPRMQQAPAALFNGMVAPLAGYGIRGAAWYQGETNTAYGEHYAAVLRGLVTSWRGAWGQGDFPFLIVQLPNFEAKTRDWPVLRAGQAQVARELPNVGLVVTIDLGESNDIHPLDKEPVGHRLALLAERIAYGREVVDSGPTFKAMRVDGGTVVIDFDHVNGGLVAKGGAVEGFEIANADGKFVAAGARIDGESVRVSAEGVTAPTSVRYAWSNDPKCTLYNGAGLPAGPFQATP